MREKRWTKTQRESERERDTDTKTQTQRESGVLFIVMHRNIFIGKNESVDERSGWDPSTLVERRTHSPPPPSLSLGARESSSVFGRRGDPGTPATQTNSADESSFTADTNGTHQTQPTSEACSSPPCNFETLSPRPSRILRPLNKGLNQPGRPRDKAPRPRYKASFMYESKPLALSQKTRFSFSSFISFSFKGLDHLKLIMDAMLFLQDFRVSTSLRVFTMLVILLLST